jgi:adenylate cyclase
MSIERKRAQGGLLIWVAASLASGLGLWCGAFDSIEQRTWDWRVRSVAHRSAHNPNVKIITIDQSSLEYVSREMGLGWPWPRSVYNPILDYLGTSGAKGVAFDLLFTEHSNEPHDDELFAEQVRRSLPVVSAVALQRRGGDESPQNVALFTERQHSARAVIEPYLAGASRPNFTSAALPFDELLKKGAAFGNVTSSADEDQIVRHTQPGAYLSATPVLSLPFALYATTWGADGAGAWLVERQNPLGELLIRYYGPAQTFQTYSMSAVLSSAIRVAEGLEPRVPRDEFKDAYVLIGGSAPGLLDLQGVPFDGVYPGVEVNATILSNLLDRSFLRETPTIVAFGASLLILATACAAGLLLKRGGAVAQVLVFAGWIGACYVAAHLGWWVPMVTTLAGLVFVSVSTSFLQYQLEGRQHRFIRKAFKHYMSPEVIEAIVRDPSKLRLGGERRELTIFFSDIQGFTGISERLPPDQLVQFLNRFLGEMSNIILASGGTLDKYQGDAIIAFWNAPLAVEDHRARAVRAAVACQRRLNELSPEFERDFGIRPRMRIGIHTGVVSVGNFGSDLRFNYTMIGDAANVASRLEGVNKVFGSYTIASDATRVTDVSGIAWRKLGSVKVVGRGEPVVVYEPVDSASATDLVRDLATYHDALSLFEEGKVREAHALFERLPDDPVSSAYRARIERMMTGGVSESPVWDVKEK